MRFLTGLLLGALGSSLAIAYVFATTTVSYRSTLFPGDLVRIIRIRGILSESPRPAQLGVTPSS